MSMHIFRAFPRSMLDLGKVHLWGKRFCSICPEVLSKWWGRAGLAFAENKSCLQVARHCVHRGFSTEDTPSLEGHLLWCFGGNLPPIQKVSLQLCEVMLCPLASSTLGLCSPAGLALRTVPHLCREGGITDVCLWCASWGGEQVLGSPCLLRVVGQLGRWDRCALQDWETAGSAMTLPWTTREMQ